MSDLDVLAPAGAQVEFGGERLDIQPLTVGQLPRMVRLVRPFLPALGRIEEMVDAEGGDAKLLGELLGIIDEHGDLVIDALAVACRVKSDFIAGGQLDDFVRLAKVVIEVNRDFFAQRLAPLLGRGVEAPRTSGAGPTSPPSC